MLPEILYFSIRISLFFTVATEKTGHQVNDCCLLTDIAQTDRPKSAHNWCVIECYCNVFVLLYLYACVYIICRISFLLR